MPPRREVAACATARKARARSRGGSSATASGSADAAASRWERWSPTDSAAASVSSAAETTDGGTAEAESAVAEAMVLDFRWMSTAARNSGRRVPLGEQLKRSMFGCEDCSLGLV